jgi:predicted RNase H-like nuclease
MWVAGADGCPGGWLVVFRSTRGLSPRAEIFKKITNAFTAPEQPKIIAVDIPIGLPAVSEEGGRSADREARKMLRLRKSSIFPAPSRRVLRARSFEEAKAIEQGNSEPPKTLTKQVSNILCKIREVDAIASLHSGRIFECHPEVSFWAMNNKNEMSAPKRKSQGLDERRKILAQNKFARSFLTTRIGSYKEHSRDDLTDACAAAWTAERILKKEAIRFPVEPDLDDCGLDMAIWA